MLADRVDFFFAPLIVALPFLKDGKVQALAVSGSQRAAALPDVPTTVEAGFPNSEYNFWVGMFAPSKTPSPILDKLYAETRKALQIPQCRKSSHAWAYLRPDDAGIREAGAGGGGDQYENCGHRGSESQLTPSRRP